MATAESVKAQLEALLAQANSTTGNEDATLTAAVAALAAGFGQGGGVQMLSGNFTPAENLSEYTLTFPKPIENFVVLKHTNALTYGVRTTIGYVKLYGMLFLGLSTNMSGNSISYVGTTEKGFTLSEDGMALTMDSTLYSGTVFVPEQYDWVAW